MTRSRGDHQIFSLVSSLLFDLLCGLWDVGSDVAPRNMNIASPSYSLEASSTKVLLGEATVADDPNYVS